MGLPAPSSSCSPDGKRGPDPRGDVRDILGASCPRQLGPSGEGLGRRRHRPGSTSSASGDTVRNRTTCWSAGFSTVHSFAVASAETSESRSPARLASGSQGSPRLVPSRRPAQCGPVLPPRWTRMEKRPFSPSNCSHGGRRRRGGQKCQRRAPRVDRAMGPARGHRPARRWHQLLLEKSPWDSMIIIPLPRKGPCTARQSRDNVWPLSCRTQSPRCPVR